MRGAGINIPPRLKPQIHLTLVACKNPTPILENMNFHLVADNLVGDFIRLNGMGSFRFVGTAILNFG
jgi:hypothetical protein